MALHAINVVYYVGSAKLYKALPGTFLAFQLMSYSIGIPASGYEAIAGIHAAVAIIHAVCILVMIGSTAFARRLAFYPAVPVWSRLTILFRRVSRHFRGPRVSNIHEESRFNSSRLSTATQLVISSVTRTGSLVFGREGLLGVDSAYFDDVVVIRELFETLLQSYQAYRMTQLLPRLGLIRVYVALLVLNCWAVPILHRVYKTQPTRRRISTLSCDALLDIVSSIGITLQIFATYAPQYNDPVYGFPFMNWFDDQWFMPLYQEFQMMLVVSWGDMASRLVFALGLLLCMESMKAVLEPEPTKRHDHSNGASLKLTLGPPTEMAKEGPQPESTKPLDSRTNSTIVPASSKVERMPVVELPVKSGLKSRLHLVKHFLFHTVAPAWFILWGCVILVVHMYAESKFTDWPCSLRLCPWFHSKPACAVVLIDCNELGVSGTVASLETMWTKFEPGFTAHLTIRHCRALEVPVAIRGYNRLTTMKVYNSTMTSWSESAAVTSKIHKTLRALYFLRSTFPSSVLPPGLTSRDFPKGFRCFIASETNLATLPDDLHRSWPPYLSLALEGSQFTAVPEVVMRLLPVAFSLVKNPLSSVPASLFEIPTLLSLHLSDTLIQELPREVTSPSPYLYFFMIMGTNVSTLWPWMNPTISRTFADHKQLFNAQGTRFCTERDAIEAGNRTRFSAADTWSMSELATAMDVSTAEKLAYSKEAVTCGFGYGSYYPLRLDDMANQMGADS